MSTEGLPAPELVDLVVLGSGAAALAAAATAAGCGARVLVLEKTELLGGTSALSGGEIWIPGSQAARDAGVEDSLEACETYLRSLLGAALDPARVRVVVEDIGGGFGARFFIYPEYVAVAFQSDDVGNTGSSILAPVEFTVETAAPAPVFDPAATCRGASS